MDWAILVLRFGLGFMFVAHGLQMAFGLFGGPGVGGFSQMLSGMGFRPAMFWSYLAAYTTLIGGLCVLVGFLTRVAAFSLLVFMIVAVVKVHIHKGFFITAGGFEYNFVIMIICIALIITGAGKYSINNKL